MMPSWIVETPVPVELVLERLRQRCDEEPITPLARSPARFRSVVGDGRFEVRVKPRGERRGFAAVLVGRARRGSTERGWEVLLRLGVEDVRWALWLLVGYPVLASSSLAWVWLSESLALAATWTAFIVLATTTLAIQGRRARRRDAESLLALFEFASGAPRASWGRRSREVRETGSAT